MFRSPSAPVVLVIKQIRSVPFRFAGDGDEQPGKLDRDKQSRPPRIFPNFRGGKLARADNWPARHRAKPTDIRKLRTPCVNILPGPGTVTPSIAPQDFVSVVRHFSFFGFQFAAFFSIFNCSIGRPALAFLAGIFNEMCFQRG